MHRDAFTFTRIHSDDGVTLVLVVYSGDALEHFREMSHDGFDLFGVTNNLKQVFVTDEVEPGKVLPLLLEILAKSLLNELQRVGEVLEGLLQVGDLHNLKYNRRLVDHLHEACKVSVEVLELGELVR